MTDSAPGNTGRPRRVVPALVGAELRSAARAVSELEDEMAEMRRRLREARERRRVAVLAARAEGASYAEIGGILGVSPQRARAIASDVVFAARRAAAREGM